MNYHIDNFGDERIAEIFHSSPTIIVRNQKSLAIEGWASDETAHLPAGKVEINIDGKLYPVTYGLDRPDVAKAYNVPAYKHSGFKGAIPISKIGKGKHYLQLKVFSNNKKTNSLSKEIVNFEIQ